MSHYRIAVVGRFDQKADCAPWRTYQDLKLAGHAVEMVDARHCKGLLVDGELDRDMLAPFMDVFAPDYVAYRGESAGEILQALDDAPAHEGPAPRHFVVDGYVGRDNFGDEFLFKTICERLRRDYPGSWVSLVGRNPAGSLARHGVAGLPARDKAGINALLNGASALIFMGGILLDYNPQIKSVAGSVDLFLNPTSTVTVQTALADLAWLNGVPTVYLGIGAGPLAGPDAQGMVRLASLTRPRYIARDGETERLLLDAGVDAALVSRGADLAYAAEYPTEAVTTGRGLVARGTDGDAGYVAWALREHEPYTERIVEAAARAADALYEERGLASVLLAFEPGDAQVNEQVKGRMQHPEAALLQDTDDFDLTTGIIGGAELVVAMRLHGTIVAAAQGVPAVGLSYNVKVAEAYRTLGMEKYLLPVDATGEQVTKACRCLLDKHDEACCRVSEAAAHERAAADAAFEEFEAVVDAHEPAPAPQVDYPRSESVDALRARDAQRKLKRAQAQLKEGEEAIETERARSAELQAELDRVKNSRTWRLRSKIRSILHLE